MRLGPCYENTNILYFLLGLKFSFKNTDFRLTLKIKESLRKFILKIITLNLLSSDKEAYFRTKVASNNL